jgi:hypothetical protein
MSWNLRVVFNNKTKKIGFKEVYYTKKGKPKSWTKEFVKPEDYLAGKFKNPKALKKALLKPILKENEKRLTTYFF